MAEDRAEVERVARALFEHDAPRSGFGGSAPYELPRWEDQGPGLRAPWYDAARVAIAALRGPVGPPQSAEGRPLLRRGRHPLSDEA